MSERARDDSHELTEALAEAVRILDEAGRDELDTYLTHHPLGAAIRAKLQRLEESGMLGEIGDDTVMPERLGEFELRERLGSGGMGVVYRAFQPSLGREVALKLVRPEHLYFDQARARFRREVEAVARLEHPGIVRVYAAGEEAGVPFLAMERVAGVSLDRLLAALQGSAVLELDERAVRAVLLRTLGHPAPTEAPRGVRWIELCCRWVRDLALAVDHAHRHGVLHRDLKPSNVMVTPDLEVRLLDFGLASTRESAAITRTGSRLGSVPYMAPEVLRGESRGGDERADVYGLGVTLYELLTLRCPYVEAGDTEEQTRLRVLAATPAKVRTLNPAVSWDVETVCAVAMEPDPVRRYASAEGLARDLQHAMTLRPIAARRAGPVRRLRRLAQRRPAWAVGVVLGTLLVVVAPTAFAIRERVVRDHIDAARHEAESELDTQRAILAFLNDDLLAAVSPDEAGREASLREVLDTAAARIEGKFASQPHVEAAIRRTIGHTYCMLDALDVAEPHLERAAALSLAEYGAEDRRTWEAQRSLAILRWRQGRLDESETLHREVLARARSLRGPDDIETLTVASNLGLILVNLGKYAEAEPLLNEVVAARLRSLGEDDRATLQSMTNLGQLYYVTGRGEAAAVWWQRALAGMRRALPSDHPDLLVGMMNWANLQWALGHRDETRTAYRELVASTEAVYGPRHLETIRCLMNQGSILANMGDFAAAEPVLVDALERAGDLPPDHDLVLSVRMRLASVRGNSGRVDAALAELDGLLAVLTRMAPTSVDSLVIAGKMRAQLLLARGDADDADAQCRRTLEQAVRGGITGTKLAEVHLLRARCLDRLERYADEIACLQDASELLAQFSPHHDFVGMAYAALERACDASGQSFEAAMWRQKHDAWRSERAGEPSAAR